MARSNRDERAKRVERWQDSGLTAAEFGAEVGVNPRTLSYWKWRLGKDDPPRRPSRSTDSGNVSFVELTNMAGPDRHAGGGIELVIGRYTLRIGSRAESETLARVIDVLERRA